MHIKVKMKYKNCERINMPHVEIYKMPIEIDGYEYFKLSYDGMSDVFYLCLGEFNQGTERFVKSKNEYYSKTKNGILFVYENTIFEVEE